MIEFEDHDTERLLSTLELAIKADKEAKETNLNKNKNKRKTKWKKKK